MIRKLKEEKSLSVKFRYVHTDLNPADLLTKGITLENFQQNLSLWSLGPEQLSKNPIEWPTSELQCLSSKINSLCSLLHWITYTVTSSEPQPVIPFDRYSGFNKPINVTANLFKIRNKLNLMDQDPSNSTKIYLLNVMQQQNLVTFNPPKIKKYLS